jgi:hypothetical protein
MGWFIRQDSVWRLTNTPPSFGVTVVERTGAGESVLLAPPGASVAINGVPFTKGIHVLEHKDEISQPDGTLAYFTTEALPQIVSFSGPPAKCGRCRSALQAGAVAVRCACGVWYHHVDPPCFEYGDRPACVACGRPTRLDASSLWSPEAPE